MEHLGHGMACLEDVFELVGARGDVRSRRHLGFRDSHHKAAGLLGLFLKDSFAIVHRPILTRRERVEFGCVLFAFAWQISPLPAVEKLAVKKRESGSAGVNMDGFCPCFAHVVSEVPTCFKKMKPTTNMF